MSAAGNACSPGRYADAVMLTSPRCVWPGCYRPTSQCQADHMLPHLDDGPTSTANGAPLCGHHNRWKTSGYTTHRDRDGHWHHHRPDGTEIGWRADLHSTEIRTDFDWQLEHVTLDQLLAA